jgi:phenylpropionate dioxygenase-like ring-hydroxylating dioxygenase large terminal subunit
MPTTITLRIGDEQRAVTTNEDGTEATAAGTCPHCGVEPFAIAGGGMRIATDDRAYEADGRCVVCGEPVGLIRAEAETIFGLTEDEAVLRGRARVY